MSELISFGGGIAAGLLTNAMWDLRHHFLRRLTGLTNRRPAPLRFDPLSVGFYPINQWTPARLLERHQLRMRVTGERPDPAWLDQDEWQAMAKEHAQSQGGDTAYLVAFDIDHRESDRGEFFSYTVTPCDYSEHLATVQYLDQHPDTKDAIAAQLAAGRIAEFASHAPPGLVKVNVAVLRDDNHFLAIQRSGAVHGKRGLWTVGPNETMRLPARNVPGASTEDLFGLAERCLREELGLEPANCERLTISWIGYEARTASVKVFAQARTYLSELALAESMTVAHGLYEAQRAVWLPFTRRVVLDVVKNWDHGDSGGRLWSSSAPFALQELWRMRTALAVCRH